MQYFICVSLYRRRNANVCKIRKDDDGRLAGVRQLRPIFSCKLPGFGLCQTSGKLLCVPLIWRQNCLKPVLVHLVYLAINSSKRFVFSVNFSRDLLLRVFYSNPQSRFVNSQLVCLPPVGIFNYVMFICNVCFLCFSGMPVNQLIMSLVLVELSA